MKLKFYELDVIQEQQLDKQLDNTRVRAVATKRLGGVTLANAFIIVMKDNQTKEQAIHDEMAIPIYDNYSVNLHPIKITIDGPGGVWDAWAEPVSYFTEYRDTMRELEMWSIEQPLQAGAPDTDEPYVELSMRL